MNFSRNPSFLVVNSTTVSYATKTTIRLSTTPISYYVCTAKAPSLDALLLFQALECYVNPLLSLLGLGANFVSLVIIKRSGIHKPSNVLLFGLVIADISCLMLTVDYAIPILYFGPDKLIPAICGFQYNDMVNYFLTISSLVLTFFGFWGLYVNPFIQFFITLKRLLAVFIPMTFKKIVTRFTATFCVSLSFLFWLPWTVVINAIYEVYQQKISRNVNYMVVTHGRLYFDNREIIDIFDYYVVDSLDSWIPLILVTFGTLAVFVKVKFSLKRRQKLTKSLKPVSWSARTTRTLMSTSVVFIVAHACGSIIIYVFPASTDSYFNEYLRNSFFYLVYIINGSSSLPIFLVCNNQFLEIFLSIFRRKK